MPFVVIPKSVIEDQFALKRVKHLGEIYNETTNERMNLVYKEDTNEALIFFRGLYYKIYAGEETVLSTIKLFFNVKTEEVYVTHFMCAKDKKLKSWAKLLLTNWTKLRNKIEYLELKFKVES